MLLFEGKKKQMKIITQLDISDNCLVDRVLDSIGDK